MTKAEKRAIAAANQAAVDAAYAASLQSDVAFHPELDVTAADNVQTDNVPPVPAADTVASVAAYLMGARVFGDKVEFNLGGKCPIAVSYNRTKGGAYPFTVRTTDINVPVRVSENGRPFNSYQFSPSDIGNLNTKMAKVCDAIGVRWSPIAAAK